MTDSRQLRFLGYLLLLLLTVGSCNASAGTPADPAIKRALRYLAVMQLEQDKEIRPGVWDWEGNWPQVSYLDSVEGIKFRDISPFLPAAIYHALAPISEDTAPALGLSRKDVARAQAMRRRALDLAERFASPDWRSDRGSYGFWPRFRQGPDPDVCHIPALLARRLVGLDAFWGDRAPANMCFWLRPTRITSDADTTAHVLAARIVAAELDGGDPLPGHLQAQFAAWRDRGTEPMRITHAWMSPPTGAFLTWLPARAGITPQDVDLVVNANVLFFLGRYGTPDTPGASEAVDLINRATVAGRHQVITDVTQYYPDNLTYHYAIARAYDQGGVTALQPAVAALVDELEADARIDADGVYWDRGEPWLNTALAVSTLISGAGPDDLIQGGLDYLRQTQHPLLGNWPTATFFLGTTSSDSSGYWQSSSWVTAMALEALIRGRLHELATATNER